jgi:hypothetical protein
VLFILIFGRLISYIERRYSERLELVAKPLPIINNITNLANEGKISPEQAELLHRQIISGTTKFIDSGAVIPEIRQRSHFDPASLLEAAPRLLLRGPPEVKKAGEEPSDDAGPASDAAIPGEDVPDSEAIEREFRR